MCVGDVSYTLRILQDILPQRSENVRTMQAGDSKNVEEQNSTFKGLPRVDHTPSDTWLSLANTFQKLLDLL